MGFFNWLTEGVRKAIVRGVEQAAAELNEDGREAEITIRLPAHREPFHLPQEELPTTNGRRRTLAKA